MYDDFFRRAREYANGFAFEIQINRESPATRIFDILRERSFLFETRGSRHFSIKEAVYRAAGGIEPSAHVQPGAVEHFWAEYTGESFERTMVNIANLLNHLILVQSEHIPLIQGFGNLSAPPMVFSTPGKKLIYSLENKLMHRKLMPDVDTFALRPVNPGFSMDKMMATLGRVTFQRTLTVNTYRCDIRV